MVKTMTITCERRQLVNFSTVYLTAYQRVLAPRDSPITSASDLSGRRVCVVPGTTSLDRVQRINPAPIIISVVTWADCLVAIQQRQADAVSTDDTILAGLVSQDPYLHRGSDHEPGALRHRRQPDQHRPGPIRQRHAGPHPRRRDLECVVPQVVIRSGAGAGGTDRTVFGPGMTEPTRPEHPVEDGDPGAARSSSTPRPPCGRWPPRRCTGRRSTTTTGSTSPSLGTEAEDRATAVAGPSRGRRLSGGGLVEIPRVPGVDPLTA